MFYDKKVAFYTLGCKLNFAETSTIARSLENIGFIKTDFDNAADLFVVNTCSVTENANRECRRIIRKAKKNSPNSFVIVTGCYAQLKPNEISEINGVDMVLGANDKFNIEKIITNLDNKSTTEIHGCEINNLNYISSYSLSDRTRSFMKIQDGCDYPCSYCTIPLARGKNRGDSIKNIIKNAEDIANNGIKEIVITGVNIGTYKDPTNMKTLTDLLLELEKVKGINRYRISSIEPNLITNEIIDLVKNSNKFMPHFHIPLQSGSNNILKKMRRRYQRELYAEKINKIYKEVQDVCIGADVIVGFPGETDVEFHETLNFIKSLPISYLHVFSYSERENTKALLLPNPVPKELKKTRSKQIRILSNKLQQKFYRKQINKNYNVLFEEEKDGMIFGFTDNYIRVKVKNNSNICNTVKKVQLSNIASDGIMKANII